MNLKLARFLTLALASAMLLSFAAILPIFAGPNGTMEAINPDTLDANFIYTTAQKSFGDTIDLQVLFTPNASDIPRNISGWEVSLGWNASLLDYVSSTIPTHHLLENASSTFEPVPVVDQVAGTFLWLSTAIGGAVDITGPVPVMEMTFQIILAPSILDPVLIGAFDFLNQGAIGGTYMLDDGGTRLTLSYPGGYYEYSWVAPTEMPYLEVRDPVDGDHDIVASAVGQVRDIDIYIHNCSASWEMVSVYFELYYNSSILKYVDGLGVDPAFPPDYDNGTFMESFVGPTEYGIVYLVRADFEGEPPPSGTPVGTNKFAVGVFKFPNISTGEFEAPFPDGEGLLITLRLETLFQGLFPDVLTSELGIANARFLNRYDEDIAPGVNVNGTFTILPKVLGRSVDVFTCYPAPFGGQGLGQPSDMFWPQKEVCLKANVTYNDWPEQSKDVAFQIIDPHGVTWAILFGRTNASGIAEVCFRLPWPCDDPENWIGEWTVIATVDVACEIVNDTVTFKYDFLVNIVKVTLDQEQYAHCELMNITVEFNSYAIQTYSIIIAITALDETGVPFGYIYIETEIGGATYCQYKTYEVEGSIHVIKWARAGSGTIVVGALNDFPINGGTVQSGPFEPQSVTILATWA
jgi:hypothetical protein